jgi:endonuclease/exonuclease/phosphatase (EEP) superfamily protein YafD
MEGVLSFVGLLMMAATILPIFRSEAWWVRIFDFPRLQITLFFALIFILYLGVREDPSIADNVFLLALSACLGYQLYRMYPYTPLSPKQVQRSQRATPESTISLLIFNVYMENRNARRILDVIREHDPDVILTVETDSWWERELAALAASHRYTVKQPQANTYGMLLYSRLELIDPRTEFLVEDDIPSIHAGVRLRSGERIELRCVHPRPPAPAERERTTERDAELLIVGKALKGKDVSAIVIGDLNDVAWSHTNDLFQSISGLLDPRVGRGFFSTFNANWPLLRFPLDHAFCSRDFRLVNFKRLRHCGSDHFPVLVQLSLEPDAKAEQKKLPTSAEEQTQARSKIARAGEEA